MDNTERFSDRVDDYAKYRPLYPTELFDFIHHDLLSEKSSVIADIGSGTGISSLPFLKLGHTVFGVEPNTSMREFSLQSLKELKLFTAIDGTAEETGLPNNYADLIFCAQAFHWFDPHRALAEFKRILKVPGIVALVWNDRNTDDNEFSRAYEDLILKHAVDYKKVNHKRIDLDFLNGVIPYTIKNQEFSNYQLLDLQGLIGRLASSSYMPPRDTEQFTKMLKDLDQLFHRHNFGGEVKITYTTRLFYFFLYE
jgi:SAM-dependent methyltransferase